MYISTSTNAIPFYYTQRLPITRIKQHIQFYNFKTSNRPIKSMFHKLPKQTLAWWVFGISPPLPHPSPLQFSTTELDRHRDVVKHFNAENVYMSYVVQARMECCWFVTILICLVNFWCAAAYIVWLCKEFWGNDYALIAWMMSRRFICCVYICAKCRKIPVMFLMVFRCFDFHDKCLKYVGNIRKSLVSEFD